MSPIAFEEAVAEVACHAVDTSELWTTAQRMDPIERITMAGSPKRSAGPAC